MVWQRLPQSSCISSFYCRLLFFPDKVSHLFNRGDHIKLLKMNIIRHIKRHRGEVHYALYAASHKKCSDIDGLIRRYSQYCDRYVKLTLQSPDLVNLITLHACHHLIYLLGVNIKSCHHVQVSPLSPEITGDGTPQVTHSDDGNIQSARCVNDVSYRIDKHPDIISLSL